MKDIMLWAIEGNCIRIGAVTADDFNEVEKVDLAEIFVENYKEFDDEEECESQRLYFED